LKSVSLPVPELIGVAKIGSVPGYARILYLPKKSYMSSIQTIWLCAIFPQFSIAVLSGRCEPPILGREGEAVGGRGWLPFERALVSSYRPSIVNVFSIFPRFRDIAAFLLQHATFPYTTSILPQISLCSPGNRWIAFSLHRAKVLC